MRLQTLVIFTVCALASSATSAFAEDPWPAVSQANDGATAAFNAYSYKKGMRKLYAAVELAEDAGFKRDKRLAATYALLAIGAVAGRNDTYRGLHYFVTARRLDPAVKPPKALLTPQINQVWQSAGKAIKALKRPKTIKLVKAKRNTKDVGPGKIKPLVKKGARGLIHDPLDEARRGYPIPVKAVVGVDVRASHYYLYFRRAGTVKYTRLEMKPKRGAYRAKIPPTATRGNYLHYYIEARDPRGRVAAKHGSARGPNVVIMK